jgi:tRNA pseudouridine13 synthase
VELPFVTSELPGCGGRLKAEPAHFVVQELPLYEPSGEGGHLYVSLTREGWNTRRVAEALASLYGVPVKDIGYAGLKDRHARCTQTFSVPNLAPQDAERIAESLPFRLGWARRHSNKLKVGHLAGNKFFITVTNLQAPLDIALERAKAIAGTIAQRGVPNFYGSQRFGIDGGNIAKGRAVLLGQGPHWNRWLRRLLISAYQSHLFNVYLVRRLEMDAFQHLLPGDIAKKADTGGMFQVHDLDVEQARYEQGEIHFTGPMYGRKMWEASGAAGQLEKEVLAQVELTAEHFARVKTQGTRRAGRLWLPRIELSTASDTLHLEFSLPKGAYATVVLREFTKTDVPHDPDEEGEDEL